MADVLWEYIGDAGGDGALKAGFLREGEFPGAGVFAGA